MTGLEGNPYPLGGRVNDARGDSAAPPYLRQNGLCLFYRPLLKDVDMTLETWELLSYIVTVVALPFAIGVFLVEQRKERANEQEATWQQISDAYIDFLEVVLANPDLKLRSQLATPDLTDEQRERMLLIFDMLISLFERAYLLIYEPNLDEKKQRRWHSWEDYMREWSRREDFRERLPQLLRGEDPDFAVYLQRLTDEEASAPGAP
jgi:hypothetical protein